MNELPVLMGDLAYILVLAGIVTIIFKRLNQPLVLGYIVAGFICGPKLSFLPSIVDLQNVNAWAEIGVVFLMFTLGLEFSFKKILKMGSSPFIAACTIIFCMIGLGAVAGHAFGWTKINSLFLGGMLAMSSTTIIFKALDDLGLRQKRFAGSVLSVLVVEDILGILLMVVLAMVAVAGKLEGADLAWSMFRLVLVLVVWFLVGVFIIPTFLRRNRKWISRETLLIVSLGLCFLMVVIAVKTDYSAAFGAFMMGSILAETIEAEQINAVVAPVKDLFGAIFFVSVGMLVDPAILLQYWIPILVLVCTILIGQTVFGTIGFLLSGQPLKVAIQCGFCMTQIGEFAFIIASLGVSLKVTAAFLYPVVVAVSVITTFLTPYMIKAAVPACSWVEKHLPSRIVNTLEEVGSSVPSVTNENVWKRLIFAMVKQVVSYSFLTIAVITLMLTSALPALRHLLTHWWGNAACGIMTIALISLFLRAIVMRKNHSEDFRTLWRQNSYNRFPLLFTILARFALSCMFIFYVINYLSPYSSLLHWIISVVLMFMIIKCKSIKTESIRLESLFLKNLRSREIQAEQQGRKQPEYAESLRSKDVHLSILTIPMSTQLAGCTLKELDLANKYGVMVAAVIREGLRINIPGADVRLFPGDKLQIIGDDENLSAFARRLESEVNTDYESADGREMVLRSLAISTNSPFVGKSVSESGLREQYQCMLVGCEDGNGHLLFPKASHVFQENEVIWLVGERASFYKLAEELGIK